MDVWSGGRDRSRSAIPLAMAGLLAGLSGCTIAPKRFSDTANPAPLVRARAATMGDHLPSQVVVPALLDRLNDSDPVVRLTAHEELKRRTRQDFGYQPMEEPAAREQAVARWRAWWSAQSSRSIAQTVPSRKPVRRSTSRPMASTVTTATSGHSPSRTGGMTQVRHSLPHVHVATR